jgi:hypothetical protein
MAGAGGDPSEVCAANPIGPVMIPVSVGELADKMIILEIKAERIADPAKQADIRSELRLLRDAWDRHGGPGLGLAALMRDLKTTNERLWEIEDEIRDCERHRDFGPRFIQLARSVYRTNDRRFELKRRINEIAGSSIVEQKSHGAY